MDYVLAMYDVRGKQEYIFRSTKIKDIVGASKIIEDIYDDCLFPCAAKFGKGIYRYSENEEFSVEKMQQHLNDEEYVGEVVYNGGGNFFAIFKNKDIFAQITHDFTFKVLKERASLKVIGTCVPIENFDNFPEDRRKLYEQHRYTESTVQNIPPYASLPIVMADPNSSMPIVKREKVSGEMRELTAEQKAKLEKYKNVCRFEHQFDENVLDKIAPEKGVDSHIAVIYIDGNSMGAKVQTCLNNKVTYEECVNELRKFSEEIQREFITSKEDVIDAVLANDKKDDDSSKRRMILGAGDEINIIVAAKDAYKVAKAYLEALNLEKGYSSCAGIAIFKSHMPYYDAYRIAEECCENCKDLMKKRKLSNSSLLDFHYCQGAVDVSLDQIRSDENTSELRTPWYITGDEQEMSMVCKGEDRVITAQEVDRMVQFLNSLGHSNVKGLLEPAKKGNVELEMELRRIRAHQSEEVRKKTEKQWDDVLKGDLRDIRQKLIYDLVLMNDLWFKESGI